jgi:hypothetical protein
MSYLGRKVKIVVYGCVLPVYGQITKVVPLNGRPTSTLFEINVGTEEKPELRLYCEFDEDYEFFFI